MIVLDSHSLIWLDQGSNKVGPTSRELIDQALADDKLYVSAISFWEIAVLVDKQRLSMPPLLPWRKELLAMGLKEIPIDGELGIKANRLKDFHADLADRLITASAVSSNAMLITADQKILDWQGDCERLNVAA